MKTRKPEAIPENCDSCEKQEDCNLYHDFGCNACSKYVPKNFNYPRLGKKATVKVKEVDPTVEVECECTLAQSILGEGCEICNPSLALEHAKDYITELEHAVQSLQCCANCTVFNCPHRDVHSRKPCEDSDDDFEWEGIDE